MELTGECKEDFLNFFKKKYYPDELEDVVVLQYFDNKELVEKQALMLEFFDSVGIYIEPIKEPINYGVLVHLGEYTNPSLAISGIDDRKEAIVWGINKANEIYNGNY